ncbi:MAG: hypothetical protein AAF962_19575 [Actinomycetota bacterium]
MPTWLIESIGLLLGGVSEARLALDLVVAVCLDGAGGDGLGVDSVGGAHDLVEFNLPGTGGPGFDAPGGLPPLIPGGAPGDGTEPSPEPGPLPGSGEQPPPPPEEGEPEEPEDDECAE